MARKRYGENERSRIFKWIYFTIFLLITIWLLASIFTKKSPADMMRSIFSKMPVQAQDECEVLLAQKDSLIRELKLRLGEEEIEGRAPTRGIVLVDSQSLNMRSKPSLQSEILLKIPANAEVQILYYDSETYYLNGKAGKWVRIKYADSEGWVWGNYVKEI